MMTHSHVTCFFSPLPTGKPMLVIDKITQVIMSYITIVRGWVLGKDSAEISTLWQCTREMSSKDRDTVDVM